MERLYRLPAHESDPTVDPLHDAEGYVRYPSWSFTRSRIVFERAEEKSSVWTLTLR